MAQADPMSHCDGDADFTVLQEGTIPEFVQSSPYLKSLLENEKLPACGIKVPWKSLKQNTDICSKNDLFEFLHTMRYWMLPDETLYTSSSFLPFCFDPRNLEAITEACDEFGTEITELVGLSLLALTPDASKLACAAKNCDLPVVKYLCEVRHLEMCNKSAHCAIKAERVSFLQYFKQCGYMYRNDSVEVAISGGHLQSLEYLSEDFHLRDCSFMWVCAAKSDQIPSMEFLLKIGCEPDPTAYSGALQAAASNAHVACIEFLWNTFPHMNDATSLLRGAFQGRHLDMVKLAVAKGADLTNVFSRFSFDIVHMPDCFVCIQFLYEAGTVADAGSFEKIADQVPTECMRWMLEHGSAVSLRLGAVLAGKGDVDALKMVRAMGCPWNEITCRRAAVNGQFACLQYLHDSGCPWNEKTCSAAASHGHLECLQYLHEKGCPWDEHTCAEAAMQGHLSCLQYAHENGCPWEGSNEEGSADSRLISHSAALTRSPDCLKYVVEQGAQLSSDVMLAAVGSLGVVHRAEEKVRFLLSHHCPCDARATEAVAFWACHLRTLMLLHEGGCPWDGSLFVVAGQRGNLEFVRYAHEHGCPWPEPGTLTGLKRNCREYMIEHGCPGAENA